MSIKSMTNYPGKNTGLTFPPPGDLCNAGIKPRFPALQVGSLLTEPPGKWLAVGRNIYSINIPEYTYKMVSMAT